MRKIKCVQTGTGTKYWYLVNTVMIHREDGPAVEWSNGGKEWWLNDKLYCSSWWPQLRFAKGFVRWIEAVKELRGKK